MQDEPTLPEAALAAATADDFVQLAGSLGYDFSGYELLRLSGQKVGKVTVSKQDITGATTEPKRARALASRFRMKAHRWSAGALLKTCQVMARSSRWDVFTPSMGTGVFDIIRRILMISV
jgi:hypothetical protein